jgi:hypothetical protein
MRKLLSLDGPPYVRPLTEERHEDHERAHAPNSHGAVTFRNVSSLLLGGQPMNEHSVGRL